MKSVNRIHYDKSRAIIQLYMLAIIELLYNNTSLIFMHEL